MPKESASRATATAAPRSTLPSLTGLRSVAAFVVFGFHTSGFGTIASPVWRPLSIGFIGVGFFFVLSGVVLAWSARPERSATDFWHRRFARIYPSHLVTALIATAIYWLVIEPHKPLWALPLVLLLVHAWVPTQSVQSAGDGVSWSLSCEALFYALFPWTFRQLERRPVAQRVVVVGVLLVVCSAVAIAASFAAGGRWDVIAYEEPLVRLGEFVLGVALGLSLREGWVPRARPGAGWAALGVACAAMIALGGERGWHIPRGLADVVVLGPLVLLLTAYSGCDLRAEKTRMASRWAVYLGQVSFAFYLVHQVVMDVLVRRIAPASDITVPVAIGWTLGGLAISLLLAMALHHGVELPAQRALLARWGARTPRYSVEPGSSVPASVR